MAEITAKSAAAVATTTLTTTTGQLSAPRVVIFDCGTNESVILLPLNNNVDLFTYDQ